MSLFARSMATALATWPLHCSSICCLRSGRGLACRQSLTAGCIVPRRPQPTPLARQPTCMSRPRSDSLLVSLRAATVFTKLCVTSSRSDVLSAGGDAAVASSPAPLRVPLGQRCTAPRSSLQRMAWSTLTGFACIMDLVSPDSMWLRASLKSPWRSFGQCSGSAQALPQLCRMLSTPAEALCNRAEGTAARGFRWVLSSSRGGTLGCAFSSPPPAGAGVSPSPMRAPMPKERLRHGSARLPVHPWLVSVRPRSAGASSSSPMQKIRLLEGHSHFLTFS
mmetsp:Transcript_75317/g.162895  ORF Transcript_75317/g.162895 Transcript_75317/m.162895 type:complete len:278 (+) Transcript_75317:253-1086(+)